MMSFPFPTVEHRTLQEFYGSLMIAREGPDYSPLYMEQWQYRAAFVVHFRPETDITSGRFEGRVEHVASNRATRFHSLDELLDFIAKLLSEAHNADQ